MKKTKLKFELQNSLIEFIVNFDERQVDNLRNGLSNFSLLLHLGDGLDFGYLYSTAVFHWKYSLSNKILKITEYDLNNIFLKSEIIWCAENERFDCITKFLEDGYFPPIKDLSEMLNFFDSNNYNVTAPNVFRDLNHLYKFRKIQNFKNQLGK